jgi:hypothetical protein
MNQAFTNMHEKDHALSKLLDLCMEPNKLDKFNAKFNQLVKLAGWGCDGQGTMHLWRQGLVKPLLDAILLQRDRPDILEEWQSLANDEHGQWLEKCHEMEWYQPRKMDKAQLLRMLNNKKCQNSQTDDRMDVNLINTEDLRKLNFKLRGDVLSAMKRDTGQTNAPRSNLGGSKPHQKTVLECAKSKW